MNVESVSKSAKIITESLMGIGEHRDDPVSAPMHYTGPIECKDAMKAMMGTAHCVQPAVTDTAVRNIPPIGFFWWGCAFKYLWRWSCKGGIESLRKCQQCIDFLIEEVGE